jgi:AraC-like DNA-binding protein
MAGFDPGMHRGLPSRHMTFIVGIGAPIDVHVQTNPAQPPARYRCVLSGLQASAAQISHDGSQEGVSIELSPLGCRALLGMPAAELWDLSLESSDAMGSPGDELWERLQDAGGWRERFEICDRMLLGRLGRQTVAGDVARVWRRIVASGGTLTIGRLSAEVGYSRQHLARLFRAEFGLGPKLASRVMRFDRAQQVLRSDRFATLADAAVACGYADQAHLTREFVELAGCTPRALLGGDLPILQESAAAGG